MPTDLGISSTITPPKRIRGGIQSTWHNKGLVGWGFNDIPARRPLEILAAEFCNMFSLFLTPHKLEMYRKHGDMRIGLGGFGMIPAIARQYGYPNQPIRVLCRSRVRKSSGLLFEELDIPDEDGDSLICVGVDENGLQFATLELSSDEWFKPDTDPEWLKVFNNCIKEAVRVLPAAEVACECLESEYEELVDDDGFSASMLQKLH